MTRPAQNIARNTLYLVGGRLFSRVLQFLLFIYAARSLGAQGFGVFSFGLALSGLFSVFMDPGISTYSTQQMSREREAIPRFIGQSLLAQTSLILPCLAIIGLGTVFLGKPRETILAVLALGVQAALNSLTASFHAAFQATEDMHYEAGILAVSNLIMSLLGFVLLYYFQNVLSLCLAYVVGALLRFSGAALVAQKKYGPPLPVFSFLPLWRLIRKGFPFALVTIFVTIYYYVDSLMLESFCGERIVGLYNAAYKLIEAPLFISAALTTAIFPAAARLYRDNRQDLRQVASQAFTKMLAVGLLLTVIIAYCADGIIIVLYGEEYRESAQVLPILIFSVAIIMPSTICGTTIRAMDRQGTSALVTGAGAVFNVLLNLLVIPRYSLVGAAWTTVATEVFILILYYRIIARELGSIIDSTTLLRLGGMAGGLLLLLVMTARFGFWPQIILGGLLCPPLLVAARIFSKQDLLHFLRK